ncbi:MAG: hypothetical protein ACREUZ_17315, partial [Burkholderiales bacterium]
MEQLGRMLAREVSFGIGQAHATISHDAIELGDERRLVEHGQTLQIDVVAVAPSSDREPVIRRMLYCVPHNLAQTRLLVLLEPLARPALPFEHLC